MSKKIITYALVLMAGVGLAVAGSAYAQDATDSTKCDQLGNRHKVNLEMKADILGLDVEEIKAALQEGRAFHEILEEAGIDREEMHQKMQAARQAHIDELVANGTITAEQAEQRLERMAERPAKHLDNLRQGKAFPKKFAK
jgi:hypothetical protein